MDYVEFLKLNGASNELINNVIDKIVLKLNDEEYKTFLNKLEFVYDIFMSIGFSNNEINDFLSNSSNVNILKKDKKEIIKIVYVLNRVGVQRLLTDPDEPLRNGLMYKRIFMRDLYLKLKNGYEYRSGLGLLSSSELEAYGSKYKLATKTIKEDDEKLPDHLKELLKDGKKISSVSSDAELERFLDKVLVVNNKHVTVDKFIEMASTNFYKNYMLNKLKGKKK